MPPEMIKTVARINPSTGRLIFNAKLVTADPIEWFDGNHFKRKYALSSSVLKQRPLCIIEYFFHVANFVINIPCWLQNKKKLWIKTYNSSI
jgi:hypothetical protein